MLSSMLKEILFLAQECESEGANKMIDYLRDLVSMSKPGEKYGMFVLGLFLLLLFSIMSFS